MTGWYDRLSPAGQLAVCMALAFLIIGSLLFTVLWEHAHRDEWDNQR